MKIFELTKYDRLKLLAMCIKAITGVAGVSVILTEKHPYISIVILCIGAASNEIISFLKEKEIKSLISNDSNLIASDESSQPS